MMKFLVSVAVFVLYVVVSTNVWGFEFGDAVAQAVTISVIGLVVANVMGVFTPKVVSRSTVRPGNDDQDYFMSSACSTDRFIASDDD
ncbi:hypothetical protein [Marinobacter nauticus]|jgi:hypothetical protein|nr:hypothetical protein [Marinobacter nauticus]